MLLVNIVIVITIIIIIIITTITTTTIIMIMIITTIIIIIIIITVICDALAFAWPPASVGLHHRFVVCVFATGCRDAAHRLLHFGLNLF